MTEEILKLAEQIAIHIDAEAPARLITLRTQSIAADLEKWATERIAAAEHAAYIEGFHDATHHTEPKIPSDREGAFARAIAAAVKEAAAMERK
jgi:hypothetical protein